MQFFISFNLYRIETPSLPGRQADWLPTFLPFFFLGLDLEPGPPTSLLPCITPEPRLPHTSSVAQSVLLLTCPPTGLIGVYSILTASGCYMMVCLTSCRVVIRCKGLVWFGLHIFGRNVPWSMRSPCVGACHEICTVSRDMWSAGSGQICMCEALFVCVDVWCAYMRVGVSVKVRVHTCACLWRSYKLALAVLIHTVYWVGQGLWLLLEPACPGNPVSASWVLGRPLSLHVRLTGICSLGSRCIIHWAIREAQWRDEAFLLWLLVCKKMLFSVLCTQLVPPGGCSIILWTLFEPFTMVIFVNGDSFVYLLICFTAFFVKINLKQVLSCPYSLASANLVAGISVLCNEAGTKSSFKNVVFIFNYFFVFMVLEIKLRALFMWGKGFSHQAVPLEPHWILGRSSIVELLPSPSFLFPI